MVIGALPRGITVPDSGPLVTTRFVRPFARRNPGLPLGARGGRSLRHHRGALRWCLQVTAKSPQSEHHEQPQAIRMPQRSRVRDQFAHGALRNVRFVDPIVTTAPSRSGCSATGCR